MNYAELKTQIQSITENTFDDVSLAMFTEQAEQKIYNSVQIANLRKNVTGVLTASNPYLSCPTDFLSSYSLAVYPASGTGDYAFLLNKDVNFMREAYPDSTVTGVPKAYAIFSDDYFLIGPTPNSSFAVELHYFHKPESITTTTSGTSWLGTNAETTLLYGCLVEAYTYLKGDADLMGLYVQRYEDAIQRLEELGEGYSTTDSYRSGAVRKMRT